MLYFLDFEASSLSPDSVPIEIAWADESGQGESYLIRPEPGWTDWSFASESLHGISRDDLSREGRSAGEVARRVLQVLGRLDAVVVSDAPGFDQAWLDELLVAAGLPPRILMLRDVTEVYAEACRPMLAAMEQCEALRAVKQLVANAEHAERMRVRRRHRALDDATGLWWTWCEIRRQVSPDTRES